MSELTARLRQLASMEREMALSVLDAVEAVDVGDLGRRVRRALPSGGCGCTIPEPCWMPRSLGEVISFAAPCRTACIDIVVTNCDRQASKISVAVDGDALDATISDPDFSLPPFRRKVVRVCLTVPDGATRGQRFDGLVWVNGCREHYLRWSVRVTSFGTDSRHEIDVDDCPDQVHHWYDHFYCERPCRGPTERMADAPLPVDLLRRAWRANLDYYRALGEVTTVYLRAVSKIVGDALAVTPRPDGVEIRPMVRPAQRPGFPSDREANEPRPMPRAALVLEAAAGSSAGGVFMVGNNLPRQVTAAVEVTPFAAEGGAEVRPSLQVEPARIVLEPGGQMLVQLWAAVDETLAPGVAYRAEIRVPGMSDEAIPVILRRREPNGESPLPDAPRVVKRRPPKRARPEQA